MDPDHDGQGFTGPVRRSRERESQAVLVEVDPAQRAAEEHVARGGRLRAAQSLVLASGCLGGSGSTGIGGANRSARA